MSKPCEMKAGHPIKKDGGAPVLFDHSGTLLHERVGRDYEHDDGEIFGEDPETAQQRVGRGRDRKTVLADLHLCRVCMSAAG